MPEVSDAMVILFAVGILLAVAFLFAIFWYTSWLLTQPTSPSPYTGSPLRVASDLSLLYKVSIKEYMKEIENYDNRRFSLDRASFCRDTLRIFPNSVTWYGAIRVDWSFIAKRHPGNYVSWGSLTQKQKEAIYDIHGSLEGFQTVYSSREPSPAAIETKYIFAKPGPLYVDVESQVVVGWKEVPETQMEMLVVQSPAKGAQEQEEV